MSQSAKSPLMSAAQAGEFLGMSEDTVYSLCESGEIVHYRIGTGKKKMVRISQEQLDDFLERCEVCAAPIVPMPDPPRPQRRQSTAGFAALREFGYHG